MVGRSHNIMDSLNKKILHFVFSKDFFSLLLHKEKDKHLVLYQETQVKNSINSLFYEEKKKNFIFYLISFCSIQQKMA